MSRHLVSSSLPMSRPCSSRVLAALTAVFALLLIVSPAEAGGFSLGADIGFTKFDSQLSGDEELRYDVRAGYHLNQAMELEIQFISSSTTLDTTLTAVMLNLVSSWRPDRKISPYTLIGIGSSNLEIDELLEESIDDNGFAYQAGVGLRFEIGELDGLDARIEFSLLSEDSFDGSATYYNLVGGLSWRFDSRR